MEQEKDGMSSFPTFVAYHRLQLESSGVPEHYWEILCKKLKEQIFDAGNAFQILKIESDSGEKNTHLRVVVSKDDGVAIKDPEHIYLIDHAWTCRASDAKNHLRVINGLLERMKDLMGIEDKAGTREDEANRIFDEMWKFNQTYTIGSASDAEERIPVWYILDEFGSAIQHSNNPTFRVIPFIYMPHQIPYSILFPIKDIAKDEEVTRDYVEGPFTTPDIRDVLLLPWFQKSFTHISFRQEEPGEQYFLEGHTVESLPEHGDETVPVVVPDSKLKVYSEYRYVNEYLTHPKFELSYSEEDADVLWLTHHFTDYKTLRESRPTVYVNQFPFENIITIKDLLSIVCQRVADNSQDVMNSLDTKPSWLPTTFNLKTELPKFVSYYQHRQKNALDNHWICKPWNLARGLDTHITHNLNYILRLPFTGPKIVQKYIEDPVLYKRPECGDVKFDIRYVILLSCVKPLKAYVYRNFFLRFSNKPFELRDFDDYEKHFTVMNYNESAPLYRKLHHEFVQEFNEQYPNCGWDGIEQKIIRMLYELMVAATSKEPPRGIAHSLQSRALYAADIMLAWQKNESGERVILPKLLEVNWTPDCQRACEYYPDFYNDVFGLLFLGEEKDVFTLLKGS